MALRKPNVLCMSCFMNPCWCICEHIPQLTLKTKLSLVVHAKELKRSTNTGRLATRALTNSEMFIRGQERTTLDLSQLISEDYQSLMLYPSTDAVELNADYLKQFDKPIRLIVPDGNWRQASKVHYRHPELATVPRVVINTPNTSKYFLRAETTPNGMATLQAIAYALGFIEGVEIKNELLKLYRIKLNTTLNGRGVLPI